jgi:hypothetical protein
MDLFTSPSSEEGETKEETSSVAQGIIALIILGGGGWYFFGGGLMEQVNRDMDDIEDQVATDMVNQYNLSKKAGDPIEICVNAGMVSAGYLQAEDEPNYLKWKKVEKADCAKAGL